MSAATGSVAELRTLLGWKDYGDELDHLRAQVTLLERKLTEQQVTDETVAEVLPAAVQKSADASPELGTSLVAPVTQSIHRSSRDDTDAMAEALFPVLGRATRMMLSELFSDGSSSNGKSFTVDELYLIERESGIPMASLVSSADKAEDADVVSGMLEGIRSFVQDSFDADDMDGMRELQVGEVTVWVEWGPHAILAAVLRGFPTQEFRFEMQRMLEALHTDFDEELANYNGDPESLGDLEPRLTGLRDTAPAPKKAASSKWLRGLLVLVLFAIFLGIIILAAVGLLALTL